MNKLLTRVMLGACAPGLIASSTIGHKAKEHKTHEYKPPKTCKIDCEVQPSSTPTPTPQPTAQPTPTPSPTATPTPVPSVATPEVKGASTTVETWGK